MALAGEGYNSLETLEQGNHLRHPPDQSERQNPASIQRPKPRASDSDRLSGGGGVAGATASPFPCGSKSKTPPSSGNRYRECLKNHAASIGGNVTDGCGEFMPSGEEGSLEALKCAACACHRNFHRKEVDCGVDGALVVHTLQLTPSIPSPPPVNQHRSIPMHGNHWTPIVHPVKMAFGGGGGSAATDSSSEELNYNAFHATATTPAAQPQPPQFMVSKKRFRTKFTQEQKERMLEFAEKVGWRIPREDDAELQRFCSEVGVKRQVLKVWMHNNKNSAKKNPSDSQLPLHNSAAV